MRRNVGIKTILYEGMSFRTCFEVYILNYEQQHSMNHHSLMLLSFKSGENGQSRGSGYSSSSATETRLEGSGGLASASGSDTQNLNVIFGAAVGPGDYHGTMSKAELEREAGGRIFTSENSETRNQVETTRYQGSISSGGASGDAFGRGRGSGGSGACTEMQREFYDKNMSQIVTLNLPRLNHLQKPNKPHLTSPYNKI